MVWEEIALGMLFIIAKNQLITTILEGTIGVVTITAMVLGEQPPITTGQISPIPIIILPGMLIPIAGVLTTTPILGVLTTIQILGEPTITPIPGGQVIITGAILTLPIPTHGATITTIAGGQEVWAEWVVLSEEVDLMLQAPLLQLRN
jgi:hypothetical protein